MGTVESKGYRARRGAIYLIAFAAVLAVWLWPGKCGRQQWHAARGAVWNTEYNITYLSHKDLADSVQEVFRRVEMSLSPFNPASRISRINRGESDVTDSLIERVFAVSQRVNVLSAGAFDPTVSPLVNLWGFGYDKTAAGAPRRAQIDSALALVGIAECSIVGGRMIKKAPGTTFNFSAVTKGYGCDLVARMLRRNGCHNFMVEIGGEMLLAGHNSRGTPWRVQIDAPVEGDANHTALKVVELTDCGVATSGNYRNFHVDSVGNRLGHTISPVNGLPFQGDVVSATVVAPTCAEADALATACMASPAVRAVEMLEALPRVRALLVTARADSLRTVTVRGL